MVKLRGIPSAELGVDDWMTNNLPGQDSEDNDHVSDVVGNKTDTVSGDSLIALAKQLAAAIVTVDAFHDVPTADTADNVVASDVLGNKSDTVAGTSIVALAKQLLAAIVVVDAFHDVPTADVADNVVISDVVGNKTDTVGGNSLVALIKQVVAATAVLKESKLFPTMADGIVVTSSATARTLGAAVNITAVRNPDIQNTQNPGGTITRIPCTAHGFNTGQIVTIAGSSSNNGVKTIIDVPDADNFDFDDGTYDAELFDSSETISLLITSDFNIKYLSIENLSANAVYEIVLYDDSVEVGRAVCIKNAVQDGTVNIPILTPVIAANSIITAKCATNNAAADTCTIRIFYHIY